MCTHSHYVRHTAERGRICAHKVSENEEPSKSERGELAGRTRRMRETRMIKEEKKKERKKERKKEKKKERERERKKEKKEKKEKERKKRKGGKRKERRETS